MVVEIRQKFINTKADWTNRKEGTVKIKTLLVPAPLAPIDLLSYFLAVKYGFLDPQYHIKTIWKRSPKNNQLKSGLIATTQKVMLRIRDQGLTNLEWRWHTWCTSAPERKILTSVLNQDLSSDFLMLRVLDIGFHTLARFFAQGIDPWQVDLLSFLPNNLSAPAKNQVKLPGLRFCSIPSLNCPENEEDPRRGDTILHEKLTGFKEEVVAYRTVILEERLATILSNVHLCIMIGGPIGSGKSTFTCSFAAELEALLKGLASRGNDWSDSLPTIQMVTADSGTPTIEAISHHQGKAKAVLEKQKQKWDIDLALQTVDHLSSRKSKVNLLIADLPGLVTEITEILASVADIGIIVTNNWNDVPEWSNLFSQVGASVVCHARSRLMEEGKASMVKHFREPTSSSEGFISGLIIDLDRTSRPWDIFTKTVAELLLYKLLPDYVSRRQQKLTKEI